MISLRYFTASDPTPYSTMNPCPTEQTIVPLFRTSYKCPCLCIMQAIAQARNKTRTSLQVMRLATIALWVSFGAYWVIVQLGVVSHPLDEILWSMFEFVGCAVFSTSLVHGIYATMEQRRLIASTGNTSRPFSLACNQHTLHTRPANGHQKAHSQLIL